jgi:hypothetical protein
MKLFCVVILFFGVELFSEPPREFLWEDITFNPSHHEGYFQGWNYSLIHKDYTIFSTVVVSNLGPNQFNNGVSLFYSHPDVGSFFITQEWGEQDLEAEKGKFNIKIRDNLMRMVDKSLQLKLVWSEVDLNLIFKPVPKSGVGISGGMVSLGEDHHLRADVAFSFSPVKGHLNHYGTILNLEGQGGMEHLSTNLEVYYYSKSWELTRSITKDGYRIITGGYNGKQKNKFFKQIAVIDPKGNLILKELIESSYGSGFRKEELSNYLLPSIQTLAWKSKSNEICKFIINDKEKLGSINILESISSLLRFFIEFFFAKPYQIHYNIDAELVCGNLKLKGEGFHSFYLINP